MYFLTTQPNKQKEGKNRGKEEILMAVSSSAAAVYISRRINLPSTPKNTSNNILLNSAASASKPAPRLFLVRSSSDLTTPDTDTPTEFQDFDESSVEVPQGPPSLISALNVERALRGIPITDVDHYAKLGLLRNCSLDQVIVAYKSKVEELLNQGLDEEKLSKEMELLKESYIILSSKDERRMYDWSLARSDQPDKYMWPYEVEPLEIPPEDPPQEPEDVGPTRVVGYFILGWIVLSFILSIALNR